MLNGYIVRWNGNTPLEIRVLYSDESISYPYDSEFVELLERLCDWLGHYAPVHGTPYQWYEDGDLWWHGMHTVKCQNCGRLETDIDLLTRLNDKLVCDFCYATLLTV